MIVNEWDEAFTAKYGHKFPSSYLCFDTEFTGSNENRDLIVEIGHAMVEDGLIIDKLSLVLNWYSYPGIQASWLDYQLHNMRAIVGPSWRLTPEVVRQGMDPIKALRFYQKLFDVWNRRNLPFVAQNGQNADERLLRGNFGRFLNKSFELPQNGYFDTGGIYKATQIWEAQSGDLTNYKVVMLPHRNETLKKYFQRILNTRVPGVKWNLKLILQHYGLDVKHAVDHDKMHSAEYDATCLHWLMEEFRSRVYRNNSRAEPDSKAAALQQMFEEDMAKAKVDRDRVSVRPTHRQRVV